MQHPWLQPPTPTVASHVYASVWSQVRLWVWLCVQSSSTNCVYMYFVIPRYLAIRAAQAPCLAAPPTPTLHPHPPCTRTHPVSALPPHCTHARHPAAPRHPRCTRPTPCRPVPSLCPSRCVSQAGRGSHCAPHSTSPPATYTAPPLPTQAYDAAAFDRWGEVLAARMVPLTSSC